MGVSVCAAISLSLGIGGSEGPSAAQEVEVGAVDIVEDDEADRFVGSGAPRARLGGERRVRGGGPHALTDRAWQTSATPDEPDTA